MRIGIDARFLTHPQHGGFKTYSENLVKALGEIESPHTFVLYTDRPSNAPRLDPPRFELKRVRGTWPMLGLPWREQIALPWYAARDRLDLLHAPAQTAPLTCPCPLVVTVHDTFSLEAHAYSTGPATPHGRLLATYLRLVGRRAARRAAHVLTVSEVSKAALVRTLGLGAASITVVYEAPAPGFRSVNREHAAAEVARRFGLRSPFVLHLGSPDGRKNTGVLLQAYAALPSDVARRHDLVVAGRCAPAAQPASGKVHFIGPVREEELLYLYNAASLFAFPSLGEGFGLPTLEAMACGAPVVASDNSAMPEILADAAVLVPIEQPGALALAIERVLGDPELQRALVRRGHARAAAFSWRRCAAETVGVYERAAVVPARAAST